MQEKTLKELAREHARKQFAYDQVLFVVFDRGRAEEALLSVRRNGDDGFLVSVRQRGAYRPLVKAATLDEALALISLPFDEELARVGAHAGIPRSNPLVHQHWPDERPFQVLFHGDGEESETYDVRLDQPRDFGVSTGVGMALMEHSRHATMPQAILALHGKMLRRADMIAGIYGIPATTAVSLLGVIGYMAHNSAAHAIRMRDAMARDRAKRVAEIEEEARSQARYEDGMRAWEQRRRDRADRASPAC